MSQIQFILGKVIQSCEIVNCLFCHINHEKLCSIKYMSQTFENCVVITDVGKRLLTKKFPFLFLQRL